MPRAQSAPSAVVIGGGHNGLTAAAYLARAGWRVTVLERREILGGCCVTEEIAPGCRASTTSYIASMLRPEVIHELKLASHGLRMVPCDPALLVPFSDGTVLPWWADRTRAIREMEAISPRDARQFARVDDELKLLARYLEPFFMRPPPDFSRSGLRGAADRLKLGAHFRKITGSEVARLVELLTCSLGDFLQRNFDSEKIRTLMLANSLYGKHGGPWQPGTALGTLFHLLSGGNDQVQGFYGHVIGGMGAITQSLAAAAGAAGAELRTAATVARVDVRDGRARAVVLEDGTEIPATVILSNADPKRTFLGLVDARELPDDFRRAVQGIRMNGPCAKVNFVLAEEPRVHGMPAEWLPGQRALFTLIPSLEFAERSYDAAKWGRIPDDLWVDCVVASNVDPTLAPAGRHVMTCFVQYVPFHLEGTTWDAERERFGDAVVRHIAQYAPNVPRAIVARHVVTPLDLERTYGLTEGNIFHGDLSLDQLFFMRPVPGWTQYRTPVEGLYLCGAGAHPGGGVTGAPGRNAAHQVLRDYKSGRFGSGSAGVRMSSASTSALPKTADIIILGAGVMGASIAFQLALRKAGRVVILDKDHAGTGASGRSSALIRMHYTFAPEVELALRSLGIFRDWQNIVGTPSDFRVTGFVRIVAEDEHDRLRLNVAAQQNLGVNTRLVTREELREIAPDWNVDDVSLAAYEPDSGYGDGAGVATGFLSRARELGVEYLPRTHVTALRASAGRITGVSTATGDISAPIVIVAAGQWAAPLLRTIAVTVPIETELHETVVLVNPLEMKPRGPACIDSISCTYFRSDGPDKTLVGGFYGRRGVDPDNFPQHASPDSLADLVRAAARRVPALERAGILRGITGVYDMTPDSRPLLDPVGGVDGLHLCAGFSGMGFKISPAIGIVIAEQVLDGHARAVDIAAFRPSRFAEGRPIRAPHEYRDD